MHFAKSLSCCEYRPAAWLRVSGADAADFLQGQFSNDLRGAAPGEALYGLWLDRKGKVLADSFIRREEASFWIGSYFAPAAAIRGHLESFIVADDVAVEDLTASWRGVSLFGPGADAPAADGIVAFGGRRRAAGNREWLFPAELGPSVEERLRGAERLDPAELERMRIADGIPAVPGDIGPGELPQEGRLEEAAVSFTKGCYLGQEVMSRLKNLGRVRRRLARVRGSGAAPPPGSPLWDGARRAGEMRSSAPDPGGAGFAGLALVGIEAGPRLAASEGGAPSLELVSI